MQGAWEAAPRPAIQTLRWHEVVALARTLLAGNDAEASCSARVQASIRKSEAGESGSWRNACGVAQDPERLGTSPMVALSRPRHFPMRTCLSPFYIPKNRFATLAFIPLPTSRASAVWPAHSNCCSPGWPPACVAHGTVALPWALMCETPVWPRPHGVHHEGPLTIPCVAPPDSPSKHGIHGRSPMVLKRTSFSDSAFVCLAWSGAGRWGWMHGHLGSLAVVILTTWQPG